MAEINWSLLGPPVDVGGAFQAGLQQGRARRMQGVQDNALAELAINPTSTTAINALTSVSPEMGFKYREMGRQESVRQGLTAAFNPETGAVDPAKARQAYIGAGDIEGAMAFQQRQSALEKSLNEQQRETIKVGAKLLRGVKDEAGYQEARKAAALAGLDLADVPANYDPAYVEQVVRLGDVLDPEPIKWVTGQWGAFATDSMGRPVSPGGPRGGEPMPEQGPPAQGQGGFDAFYDGYLADAEGGYTASDGRSGAPANYGINAKYHQGPGHADHSDVRNITPEIGKRVAHDEYWVPSGADRIADPALQAIHADTAFNMGVGKAKELLARSNGDPRAYMDLRERHYRAIGGKDLPGWLARNRELEAFVQGAAPASARPTTMRSPSLQDQAASGVISAPGADDKIIARARDDRREAATIRREASSIRREFNARPEVKEFNAVRSSALQVKQLVDAVPHGDPGRAQADMALIFSFMKALDPNSVVRETEYATAQNAAGIPERVRTYFNKARDGQQLSPEQRRGMAKAVQDIYRTKARTYNEVARQYHPILKELGVENPKSFAPIAVAGDEKPRPAASVSRPASKDGVQIRVISRKAR